MAQARPSWTGSALALWQQLHDGGIVVPTPRQAATPAIVSVLQFDGDITTSVDPSLFVTYPTAAGRADILRQHLAALGESVAAFPSLGGALARLGNLGFTTISLGGLAADAVQVLDGLDWRTVLLRASTTQALALAPLLLHAVVPLLLRRLRPIATARAEEWWSAERERRGFGAPADGA